MDRSLPTAILIEPDPVLRDQLRQQLSGRWSVRAAANAYLAVPLLQSSRPPVVITEVDLPFVNGLEVCEILKGRFPDTAVIVVSHDVAALALALEAGADAVLAKPFPPQRLEQIVAELTAPHRSGRAPVARARRAAQGTRPGVR